MTQHTKEPWHVGSQNDALYILDAAPAASNDFPNHDADREVIAKIFGSYPVSDANARRIVACVNACKGIKTESLEMEVLSWITDETGQSLLQRERDELLAALKAFVRYADDCNDDSMELDRARAALAKVGADRTTTP